MRNTFRSVEFLIKLREYKDAELTNTGYIRSKYRDYIMALKHHGLIKGYRERSGTQFEKTLEEITLWDVFDAVENMQGFEQSEMYMFVKRTFSKVTLDQFLPDQT